MDQNAIITSLAKALAPLLAKELIAALRAEGSEVFPTPKPQDPQVIEVGSLVVDEIRHEVTLNGKPVALKQREFALLSVLARNPGRAFTREHLLELAWPIATVEEIDSNRTVDVHVTRIRAKLGDGADMLKTVQGVGYKIEPKG